MKKIIAFFKNRIVISILGLLAFSILIWFIGPAIKFGEDNSAPLGSAVARLIAIIVIVVVWGLNNLRLQLKNKKNNEDLVDDLEKNQQQSMQNASNEQSAEELHQIGERFSQALSTLKKLKFNGQGSKKALYELPWYIIIGPPGSGKTTALVNSTLDFPLAEQFGKGALQGVGGTRNCDWWFTNEAVLIDTAGRYTTQDSHRVVDSSAWEGFLNLLKGNRKRRPINGAIVAISLQDLLTQSEEERVRYAKTIRSRIDELMEKLEIRFPIYLMFTKADLVSGFSEFFEDLTQDEREQVWGVSLPNAPKPSDNPDFEYFDTEYNALLQRLYDRVLWRIHNERDSKRRGVIQGFPQQMENLKTIINSFVKQTFVKNRYQFQPYLRGVYFTSGTQDGTPIDRLMTSVASGFGFSRDVGQMPQQQGKSYFLGNLFKQIIFPESELVGSNRKYEKFLFWAQRAGYTVMAALTVSVLAIWFGSLTQHESFMSEVEGHIGEYSAENKRLNERNKDLRAVLPILNTLLEASKVYDKEEHPWLSGMGLYDDNVDIAADRAYLEKLKTLMLPRLTAYMESYLKQGHRGGDLYSTFRNYLMFNKLDRKDDQMILDWFKNNWAEHFHGEASKRKQLFLHLTNLLAIDFEPVKLNERLVSRTRTTLLRVPVSQRVYARIRTHPEYSQSVNLLNEFGESVRDAYKVSATGKNDLLIAWMFTIDGYRNIDLSPESEVIKDIVTDRWVLADDEKARVDFVDEELDEISQQVKEHYLSEYIKTWENVYAALSVGEFRDIRHAAEVLASFTDPVYSPLLAILQVTRENTELTPSVPEGLAEAGASKLTKGKLSGGNLSKASGYLSEKAGTRVDKQFNAINHLLRESSKRPAGINTTIQKIQQLQDFVDSISVAPEPAKQAFDISKARYQSNAGNAIATLEAYARKAPGPVKDWLEKIADQTWKVVLQSGRQHLAAEWRNRVYVPYSRGLAHGYPLNRSAKDELALLDFSEFFKPSGTLDGFYQEFVAPFINRRSWHNREVAGRSMGFSSKVLRQLKRARSIKNVFFKANPSVPGISFKLKPYHMNKQDARFTLELGGERVSYNHGPKFWKTLKWSGEGDNQRVRIIFEDLKGEFHSKVYDGPWAWFRLQDSARLKKTNKSNVYRVTYSLDQVLRGSSGRTMKVPHQIVYEIKAKSVNNPFSKNLLGAFRCPESI